MNPVIINKSGLSPTHLDKVQSTISDFSKIKEVILYGSRAMGNHREGSDIDLCFKGSQLTSSDLFKIAQALDELMLPYTFDLCIYHEIDNPDFRDHIERRGLIFYSKKDSATEHD